MKKLFPLLLALALLLSACGRREETPPDPAQNPPAETEEPSGVPPITEEHPLELDILRIEVCRSGLGSERLMEAAQALPELMRDALAVHNVLVDLVQVTIGSSPAATVQALEAGTVDIAILPAEGFAGQETEAEVLLASGPAAGDSPLWTDGNRGFSTTLWTAPTDCGLELAGRMGKEGELPAWEELNRPRWGLLDRDSLPGRRAVDLWLSDHYEGRTTADLSNAAVYADFEALLQAAEAGEIDVYLRDAAKEEGPSQTSSARLGETERFYDMVLAVSPRQEILSNPDLNLRDSLMFTLTQLCFYDGTQTFPDGTPAFPGRGYDRETRMLCQDVFGACRYGWAKNEDLDAARRLLALEGHAAD